MWDLLINVSTMCWALSGTVKLTNDKADIRAMCLDAVMQSAFREKGIILPL
jgi:hypothetical protein